MASGWLHEGLRGIKPLHYAVRRARRTMEAYRVRAWTLHGAGRAADLPLHLGYAGQLESKNYLAHLAFRGAPHEQDHGMRWTHRVLHGRAPHLANADLHIVDVARSVYRQFRRTEESIPEQRLFCLPCWVQGEMALSETAVAPDAETVRSDIRLIKRNALEYRVVREPALFDWFYRSMYLPYMATTYPGRAFLMSYDDMREQQPRSELLLIRKNGTDVAGQILVRGGGGEAHAWSLGVLSGDQSLVKAGVLAALYYFAPRYLASQGYRALDVGLSRPFLNDGVLQYKRKWGQHIVAGHANLFVLKFARGSAAANAFLRSNPFIHLSRGWLHGAVFLAAHEVDDARVIDRLQKRYAMPGISSLRFFAPDERGDMRLVEERRGSCDV